MWQYNYTDELYHYGVPGMKWGVRKALKNDVSYQKAKARYDQDFDSAAKAASKTKTFAITTKGKIKKEALDKVYSEKYDRMKKSEQELKNIRNNVERDHKNAQERTIKDYRKKMDEADEVQNLADTKWNQVKQQYKELGKTKISRMIQSARNKTDAAKAYNKNYDEASSMSDKADKMYAQAREAYKKTGRNIVERVLNNARYDKERKKR